MKRAILFTDGSCFGNPGPGGWACLLRCGSVEKEFIGTEPYTTNNRMELQAVIAGLSALKEPCVVKVITDSQYIQRAMTRHLVKWRRQSCNVPRCAGIESGSLGGAAPGESSSQSHLDLDSRPRRER